MTPLNVGRWRLNCDREATQRASKAIEIGGPEACGCSYCRNFVLKIQIAADVDEVSWLEFRVGEKGDDGKRLKTIALYKSSSALYNRLYAFQEHPQTMDWAYEITFGDRDP